MVAVKPSLGPLCSLLQGPTRWARLNLGSCFHHGSQVFFPVGIDGSTKSNHIFIRNFSSNHTQSTQSAAAVLDLLKRGTGVVILSRSTNIYTNLAFEDWIYHNLNFSDDNQRPILLLWRNEPAVVIGRHQNPWMECHVSQCIKDQVAIARRNSGGGCVYHDLANLNCCFMTSKKHYRRKDNLQLISNVLNDQWGIKTMISEREDLVLDPSGEKVSGTAAKLGSHNAYHHLTLLIDVDLVRLRSYLKAPDQKSGLVSNATASIRSPVKNLKEINTSLDMDRLIDDIARAYRDKYQGPTKTSTSPAYIEVMPDDYIFSELRKIRSQLKSWEWVFGKSPKFTIERQFSAVSVVSETPTYLSDRLQMIKVKLVVNRGIVEAAQVEPKKGGDLFMESVQFKEEAIRTWGEIFLAREKHSDWALFVTNCVLQMVKEVIG